MRRSLRQVPWVFKSPMVSFSMSKVKDKYSTSIAGMRWTACALRRMEAGISEGPRCLTFPALDRVSILIGGVEGKQPLT